LASGYFLWGPGKNPLAEKPTNGCFQLQLLDSAIGAADVAKSDTRNDT
jgi:hypothetical protein